jgi:hypothetical protein
MELKTMVLKAKEGDPGSGRSNLNKLRGSKGFYLNLTQYPASEEFSDVIQAGCSSIFFPTTDRFSTSISTDVIPETTAERFWFWSAHR